MTFKLTVDFMRSSRASLRWRYQAISIYGRLWRLRSDYWSYMYNRNWAGVTYRHMHTGRHSRVHIITSDNAWHFGE